MNRVEIVVANTRQNADCLGCCFAPKENDGLPRENCVLSPARCLRRCNKPCRRIWPAVWPPDVNTNKSRAGRYRPSSLELA